MDFYPRSPCGERRQCRRPTARSSRISIHALLAESDLYDTSSLMQCQAKFLSTLSLRRATLRTLEVTRNSDNDFYPRSPCGERPNHQTVDYNIAPDFYPRSPCGERHETTPYEVVETQISIHALLAESDGGFAAGSWRLVIFLSTLSLRRATEH